MPRILLIEDDDLVRESIQAQLEAAGHEVVPAAHGGEGLAKFEGGRFDLVLTDILMPNVEGLETIKLLRSRDAGIAIIAMSGGARRLMDAAPVDAKVDILKFADAFGANLTLHKPFSRSDLLRAIDGLVGGSPPEPTHRG
ncbi:MAG: response regulator [Alphaproteobacteria bacterium]